jgi:hypothetical protein
MESRIVESKTPPLLTRKGPGSDASRVFPMLTSGDVLLATRRLQTPIIP